MINILRIPVLIIFFWLSTIAFSCASTNIKIPILGLTLVEINTNQFKVISINRLGPFGRYSFLRKGDFILKINSYPVTREALLDLMPQDQPFFTFFKIESGKTFRVQINLRWSRKMPQYQRN